MKKSFLLSFGILLTSLSFGQTTEKYIEVSADESVELKAEKVTVVIDVDSKSSQFSDVISVEYEDEYEYYGYYDYEEDSYYEYLLEEEPDEITDEMRREYKDRQKDREKREKEQEKREAEIEKKRVEFKAFTINDLMALLTKNNISYTIDLSENDDYYWDEYEYDYEEEYDYGSPKVDTNILVIVSNQGELDRLNGLINKHPVDTDFSDVIFETIDKYYAELIPKITEKAKKQATILASSFGKKIGDVIQCTNMVPYGSGSSFMNQMYDVYGRFGDRDSDERDPFKRTQTAFAQYSYRFALVD